MVGRAARFALLSLLAVGGCGGCGSCGGDDASIAQLESSSGQVERDHSARRQAWERAESGAKFVVGDGLRTGPNSTARVTYRSGGGVELSPNTLIRFERRGATPGQSPISVLTGVIEFETSQSGELGLSIGGVVFDGRGRVRVTAAEDRTRIDVLIGSVTLESDGNTQQAAAGQHFVLDMGGAILEAPSSPEVDAGAPPRAPADAGPPAPSDAGRPSVPGEVAADIQGATVQVRREGETRWSDVEAGSVTFEPGTRVRVSSRATVALARGDERASVTGAGEVTIGPAGGALVATRGGRVNVEATTTDVRIEVPGGVIVARARSDGGVSRAEVVMSGANTNVTARSGSVDVRGSAGNASLGAGEWATLTRAGAVETASRAPTRALLTIAAGESPTIHDPRPPIAVRVRFGGQCPGDGVVELAGAGGSFARPKAISRGTGSAIVLVQAAERYRVRCVAGESVSEQAAAQGTIRLMRDSGVAPIPRRPQENTVSADRRRYTLMYQNLLPVITMKWDGAPASASYTLRVIPQRGQERTQRVTAPRHTFQSGDLDEGTYRFAFEASDGRRSQESVLTIVFDNAAPAAYLREPAANATLSGASVRVSGVAVEGASVSVDGRDLPLDGQARFGGDVPLSTTDDALAVRIAHPQRGVHYYLRRIGRASE